MGVVQAERSGLVYRGRYDPNIIEKIRDIPGRKWDPKRKVWYLPPAPEVIKVLGKEPKVEISREAREIIKRRVEAELTAQAVKEDERPEPKKPMPIKVKPFGHQVRGYNFALALFGWGDGDE